MNRNKLTEGRSLLVTGGAGFIGTNFVYYWLNKYAKDKVIVLDALTYAGNRDNLIQAEENSRFLFVHGDVNDAALVERLMLEHKVDTIVHFAAESHVDRSIHAPDSFIDTNVLGTHTLLKVAKKVWLEEGLTEEGKLRARHRFHHVSTDEVYGSLNLEDPPFSEIHPYAPNSPYAASKAASDHLVRAYHKTYGLQTSISNCSNNFGPFQYPEKLIPLMIVNMLHGKPLPVYGDGQQIRDWLYVEDHCRGIDLILEEGRPGEMYNIGGKCELTNLKLLHKLCAQMDKVCADSEHVPHSSLITHVQDRLGHDRRYAIDCSKMETELGFMPSQDFEELLKKTINWYLKNQDWWYKLMDKDYQEWLELNYGN